MPAPGIAARELPLCSCQPRHVVTVLPESMRCFGGAAPVTPVDAGPLREKLRAASGVHVGVKLAFIVNEAGSVMCVVAVSPVCWPKVDLLTERRRRSKGHTAVCPHIPCRIPPPLGSANLRRLSCAPARPAERARARPSRASRPTRSRRRSAPSSAPPGSSPPPPIGAPRAPPSTCAASRTSSPSSTSPAATCALRPAALPLPTSSSRPDHLLLSSPPHASPLLHRPHPRPFLRPCDLPHAPGPRARVRGPPGCGGAVRHRPGGGAAPADRPGARRAAERPAARRGLTTTAASRRLLEDAPWG